jgi:hypothetical protein
MQKHLKLLKIALAIVCTVSLLNLNLRTTGIGVGLETTANEGKFHNNFANDLDNSGITSSIEETTAPTGAVVAFSFTIPGAEPNQPTVKGIIVQYASNWQQADGVKYLYDYQYLLSRPAITVGLDHTATDEQCRQVREILDHAEPERI